MVSYCFITMRSQMKGTHIPSENPELPFHVGMTIEIGLDEDDVRVRVWLGLRSVLSVCVGVGECCLIQI